MRVHYEPPRFLRVDCARERPIAGAVPNGARPLIRGLGARARTRSVRNASRGRDWVADFGGAWPASHAGAADAVRAVVAGVIAGAAVLVAGGRVHACERAVARA